MSNYVGAPVSENFQSKPKRDNIYKLIQGSLLNNKQTRAEPILIFRYESQLDRDYFGWFLKHTDEKKRTWDWFSREFLPRIGTRDVLIDAGAGNRELLSHSSN